MTLGRLFGALCAVCCLSTSLAQYSCNAFANSTRSQEFVTRGGTVPAGTPCCFPFVYQQQVYYSCTTRNHEQAWCSVESVYQVNNKLWGNCQRIATPAPTTSSTTSSTVSSNTGATGGTGPSSGACFSTAVADTNSLGGTANSATTVQACQNACGADTNCVGFDFDSTPSATTKCYLHTDAQAFSNKRPAPGVSQYTKQPCSSTGSAVTPTTGSRGTPGSCTTRYTTARNTISYGGITIPAPNDTPLECIAYCNSEPNCVGFDIDTNVSPNVCYWHNSNTFGNRGTETAASQGINQYTKVEECETTTTASTVQTSGACEDSYTTFPNTGSYQGQPLGTGVTIEQCTALCNGMAIIMCSAFDYDANQRACYRHTTSYLTRLNEGANGVTQYRRNNVCGGEGSTTTATQAGGCQDTFTAFNNTFTYDGAQQAASVNSVDSCATACRANAQCNAFDFNSRSECFLHTNPNYQANSGSGPGVAQYRRNRICGGPGGGCVDSFEERRDTLSYNGQPQSGVTTVTRCRGACLAESTCEAYDFNTLDNSCFIHIAGYLNSVGSVQGINQYRRIRNCTAATSSTASTGGSTTTQSSTSGTTVNTPCPIVYETVSNTQYYDGVQQQGISTESACRASCTSSRICVGFDFNYQSNNCFLHTLATYIQSNRNQFQGVNTFRKLPCDSTSASTSRDPSGCVDTFREFRNTLAYDGVAANNVRSSSGCQQNCLSNSRCVAYDFDTNDNMCYIHTNINDLSLRNTQANGVNLNIRVPCSGGGAATTTTQAPPGGSTPCRDSFTRIPRAQAYGGEEIAGASTVAACEDACLANSSCVAYDFNSANMCYLHLSLSQIRNENVNLDVDGVTHYRRVFSCAAAPTTPPRIPGTCRDTFNEEAGAFYYGGARTEVQPLNKGTCENACIGNSACVGFDLDISTGCFLHLNAANFVVMGTATTINHYRRVPCNDSSASSASPGPGQGPTPTTVAAGGCVVTFTMVPNTLSYGGAQQTAAQTLQQCEELCKQSSSCVEFDFDTTDQANIRCFLHNSARPRASGTGVNKYVKQESGCGTTGGAGGNTPDPGCRMITLDRQNGAGGVPTTAQTESACRDECLRNRACVASDWNKEENRCYRHLVLAGVNQNAACCKRFQKDCSVCLDRYERRPEMKIVGGKEQEASRNRETLCAEICSSQSTCTGFDFDRAMEKCYLFFRPLSDNELQSAAGVDQYVLRKCGETGPSTTPQVTTTRQTPVPTTECQDTFVITRNSQVLGGEEQQNTMSVVACEGLCRANQQCTGYDFNRQSNVCYLLSFDYQTNFVSNRDVDNYRRQRCDGGEGTPRPPRPVTPPPPTGACQADIMFLMDSSGSIQDTGQNNYQLMKNFVKMVVDRLDIGQDKVRVALTIFSTNANIEFDYNDYLTRSPMKSAIDRATYIGGETFTSRGFRLYLDRLTQTSAGNRDTVRDVIILITDGNTTSVDRGVLSSILGQAKSRATVFGVGIGSIDSAEMMMIVTPPFRQNYVNVDDFSALINVLDNVILGTGCTGSGPGPQPGNQCNADIVFVIDESGSIRDSNVAGRPDNYDLLKDFIVNVLESNTIRANIDSGSIKVGALRFSDISRVEFGLNQFSSSSQIINQIRGLPFTGGNTNTTGALRTARTQVLNSDRSDSIYKDFVVLITDGFPTREQPILEFEANTLKNQEGVTILGVGVTRNINVGNLQRVSSGIGYTFTADDFTQLNSIASGVARTICP